MESDISGISDIKKINSKDTIKTIGGCLWKMQLNE